MAHKKHRRHKKVANPNRTTMCGPPSEGWRQGATPAITLVDESHSFLTNKEAVFLTDQEVGEVAAALAGPWDPGADVLWTGWTPAGEGLTLKEPTVDFVNHPPHYTTGKIEVIDFIEDQKFPYHIASVVKYLCRAPHKGTEEQDYEKALWYLNRYIKFHFDKEQEDA